MSEEYLHYLQLELWRLDGRTRRHPTFDVIEDSFPNFPTRKEKRVLLAPQVCAATRAIVKVRVIHLFNCGSLSNTRMWRHLLFNPTKSCSLVRGQFSSATSPISPSWLIQILLAMTIFALNVLTLSSAHVDTQVLSRGPQCFPPYPCRNSRPMTRIQKFRMLCRNRLHFAMTTSFLPKFASCGVLSALAPGLCALWNLCN